MLEGENRRNESDATNNSNVEIESPEVPDDSSNIPPTDNGSGQTISRAGLPSNDQLLAQLNEDDSKLPEILGITALLGGSAAAARYLQQRLAEPSIGANTRPFIGESPFEMRPGETLFLSPNVNYRSGVQFSESAVKDLSSQDLIVTRDAKGNYHVSVPGSSELKAFVEHNGKSSPITGKVRQLQPGDRIRMGTGDNAPYLTFQAADGNTARRDGMEVASNSSGRTIVLENNGETREFRIGTRFEGMAVNSDNLIQSEIGDIRLDIAVTSPEDARRVLETMLPAMVDDQTVRRFELACDPNYLVGQDAKAEGSPFESTEKFISVYFNNPEDAANFSRKTTDLFVAADISTTAPRVTEAGVNLPSASRTTLTREFYPSAKTDNISIGYKLEQPLVDAIHKKFGADSTGEISNLQLQELERELKLTPNTLVFDKDGNIVRKIPRDCITPRNDNTFSLNSRPSQSAMYERMGVKSSVADIEATKRDLETLSRELIGCRQAQVPYQTQQNFIRDRNSDYRSRQQDLIREGVEFTAWPMSLDTPLAEGETSHIVSFKGHNREGVNYNGDVYEVICDKNGSPVRKRLLDDHRIQNSASVEGMSRSILLESSRTTLYNHLSAEERTQYDQLQDAIKSGNQEIIGQTVQNLRAKPAALEIMSDILNKDLAETGIKIHCSMEFYSGNPAHNLVLHDSNTGKSLTFTPTERVRFASSDNSSVESRNIGETIDTAMQEISQKAASAKSFEDRLQAAADRARETNKPQFLIDSEHPNKLLEVSPQGTMTPHDLYSQLPKNEGKPVTIQDSAGNSITVADPHFKGNSGATPRDISSKAVIIGVSNGAESIKLNFDTWNDISRVEVRNESGTYTLTKTRSPETGRILANDEWVDSRTGETRHLKIATTPQFDVSTGLTGATINISDLNSSAQSSRSIELTTSIQQAKSAAQANSTVALAATEETPTNEPSAAQRALSALEQNIVDELPPQDMSDAGIKTAIEKIIDDPATPEHLKKDLKTRLERNPGEIIEHMRKIIETQGTSTPVYHDIPNLDSPEGSPEVQTAQSEVTLDGASITNPNFSTKDITVEMTNKYVSQAQDELRTINEALSKEMPEAEKQKLLEAKRNLEKIIGDSAHREKAICHMEQRGGLNKANELEKAKASGPKAKSKIPGTISKLTLGLILAYMVLPSNESRAATVKAPKFRRGS